MEAVAQGVKQLHSSSYGAAASRAVLRCAKATKEERMHTTTWMGTTRRQDDTEHIIDNHLVMESEDELKVWAYVMTQHNLKPILRKFGARGATAAADKLT